MLDEYSMYILRSAKQPQAQSIFVRGLSIIGSYKTFNPRKAPGHNNRLWFALFRYIFKNYTKPVCSLGRFRASTDRTDLA